MFLHIAGDGKATLSIAVMTLAASCWVGEKVQAPFLATQSVHFYFFSGVAIAVYLGDDASYVPSTCGIYRREISRHTRQSASENNLYERVAHYSCSPLITMAL